MRLTCRDLGPEFGQLASFDKCDLVNFVAQAKNFDQIRPNFASVAPKLAKFGPLQSKFAELGPHSAKIAQNGPHGANFGKTWASRSLAGARETSRRLAEPRGASRKLATGLPALRIPGAMPMPPAMASATQPWLIYVPSSKSTSLGMG